MKKEDTIKELLNYSKAIVAYVVFQNLTFLYTFAKRGAFYDILREQKEFAIVLSITFVIILIGCIKANMYLSREVGLRVDQSDKKLFRNLFLSKLFIIVLFQLLAIYVIFAYAILQIGSETGCDLN